LNLGNIDIFLAAVAETEEIVFQRRMAKEALAESSKKRQSKEPCRSFMQGKCTRGNACRFMHVKRQDLSAVGGAIEQQQELCRKYQRGQCHRGTSCHYRHVDLNATHGTEDTNRQAAELLRAKLSSTVVVSTKEEEEEEKEENKLNSEQFDQKLKEVLFENNIVEDVSDDVKFGQAGWKTRYYESKFGERARKDLVKLQREMAQSYVEGLQWVLLYYYDGCPSWSWFYPFHYAPCASDLRNVDRVKIEFQLSKPFRPVDQLMGV
jgi:5'-3' exonuclease